MPQPIGKRKNKPQARTEVTKARILDAAQTLFSESGFENTQLDGVAARAGCSRGAIYAHYASKEDLFLELMEHRVYTAFAALWNDIRDEADERKRPQIFKRWLAGQVTDPSWGTLTLEFKLYAVHRPGVREALLSRYESLFRDHTEDSAELLFGKDLTKHARTLIDRRLAVLGGALSGVVLERHFRPHLLPEKQLRELVEELFDALIHI